MAATGASAAYAALPADSLTCIPDNLPLVRAAALPGPGLTAWQALFEHASLKPPTAYASSVPEALWADMRFSWPTRRGRQSRRQRALGAKK
jgi:hypothetical protein